MKKVLMILAFVAMVFATGCRKDNPNYEFIGEYRAAEMKFDIRLDGFELQAVTLKDVNLDLKRSGKENVTGTFKFGSVRGNSYSVKGECSGDMVVFDEFTVKLYNIHTSDGEVNLDLTLNCVGTLNGNTLKLNVSYDGSGSLTEDGDSVSGDLEDGVVNVSFTKQGSSNNNNSNHEYVDLGLPSGTLWATCNVGANAPEEYGDYFAWGETQPQADNAYNWESYKYANGTSYENLKFIKYCNNYGYNDFTDTLTVLLPEDDAATANWGSGWRMPTQAELIELKDNCTVKWTTRNGVNGRLFTAANGNSIFLPAAGFRGDGELYHAGSLGCYCSSSLHNTDFPFFEGYLAFDVGYYIVYYFVRSYGLSVRPVRSN